MNAGIVILILKIAVIAVTVLWLGSLIALALGKTRLHGRINIVFFALTLVALFGLEVIARVIGPPGLFDDYLGLHDARLAMRIHLGFSVPSAVLLFAMLFTGLKHKRKVHIAMGLAFSVLWIGTFITGVFFLPHELPW
ncbi:MAG: hypothetical protein EXS16_16710 [Gemmataceae bacterium]|nr:hypothetical protein [Gemmataceae bacterium]